MHNFKKILCTTLAFLLLVGVVSVAFMEVYFRREGDSFQDGSDREALAGSLEYLICGASHGYRAFDPAVMDPILGKSGYNISGALMTMGGRYEMLSMETDRNPVDTVILELSFNAMTRNRAKEGTEGDLYVMARLQGFWRRFRFFFTGFRLSEYPDVYYKFVTEGIDATQELLSGNQVPASNRSRGYLPTGPRKEELDTDYAANFHTTSLNMTTDPYNEANLEKILTLCKNRGIRVILVTTPITDAYLCKYDNFQYFYEGYQALAEQWGLEFYDFNLYREKETLFPDETMFYDVLHLNDEGAALFSQVFADLLVRADRGEDISDLFYHSYGEMERAVFQP